MEKKVISDCSGGRKVQAQDSDRFQCLERAAFCFPDAIQRCPLRGDDIMESVPANLIQVKPFNKSLHRTHRRIALSVRSTI